MKTVGDPTKFCYIWEYYAFHIAVVILLLAELFIFLYTICHNKFTCFAEQDHGTKWLLYFNFVGCLLVSVYSVSQSAPALLRQMMFSAFVADIGIIFIPVGTIIRLCAVLSLKRAFTLQVQTLHGQHLVTSGLYHVIRHPAYLGSILSLSGVAMALRNIVAVCFVLFCSLICYGIRIRVEEKALQAQFGKEYAEYMCTTYKLLPYIF